MNGARGARGQEVRHRAALAGVVVAAAAVGALAASCDHGTDNFSGTGGSGGSTSVTVSSSSMTGSGAASSSAGGTGATGGTGGTGGSGGTGGAGAGGGAGGGATGVTVHAYDAATNAGVSGVDVTSHNADGSVLAHVTTGVDGDAILEVPSDGSVVVYEYHQTTYSASMWRDLTVGSVINVVAANSAQLPVAGTAFQVTVTNVPAGAATITVRGACGAVVAAGGVATLPYDCLAAVAPTESILVEVSDASGAVFAWGFAPSLTPSPGASTDETIDASNTAFVDQELEVTDVPQAGFSDAILTLDDRSGAHVLEEAQATFPSPATVLSASLHAPAATFDRFAASAHVDISTNGLATTVDVTEDVSPPPSSPVVVSLNYPFQAVDALNVIDPVHPKMSWSTPAPAFGVYRYVSTSWLKDSASVTWTIAGDPKDGRFSEAIPDLPAELAAWAPSAASQWSGVTVAIEDDDFSAGYASWASAAGHLALPANGTSVVITGSH